MKVLCSMLLLVLFALCASAQSFPNPPAGPNVWVIQKKWRMEVHNPALDKDPLQAIKEREQEVIEQREVARANQSRARLGLPLLPQPIHLPELETGPHRISVSYIYEVKVSNTGEKAIRTLTWEYVFFEPGTEREVGRRRFVSKVSISPGRTRNVVVRSTSSPTGTLDATKAGRKPRELYSERVVIQSVGYADGSVWQAASH